jgi:N-formylglutamate deformylase
MKPVDVIRGDGPVILGMPHVGTHVPDGILARLTPLGRTLGDTDWHVDRLYDGLLPGVTMVRANFHRYVIDANRDPSGASLYPGQNTTGLCPVTDFDGRSIYHMGEAPQADEIEDRRERFHAPYHAALAGEIDRVRARHGVAILYDCHSIRSRIPFLFEGVLPDFNIGDNDGKSCAPQITQAVAEICASADGYASVVNGRFKGGWTTRHYGRPADGVHAIQMELAQSTHLASESPPFAYDNARAGKLRPHLREILETIAAIAPTLGAKA